MTDKFVILVASLLALPLTACQSPSVAGDWVWSAKPDDDETVKIGLAFEEDDAGEIDGCRFSRTETEAEDDGTEVEKEKGKCEVTRQSDGGFEVEIKLTSYTEDEGEGEGPEDELDDLRDDERKFRWDCSLLEEEDQLECWEEGGDFYVLKRD